MQVTFKALSLSYQKAQVETRERFHLSSDESRNLMHQINSVLGIEEVMVVSTCNRTEIYYSSEEDLFSELLTLLCLEKGIAHSSEFASCFVSITDEEEAVRYLFEVAMGLRSQVIGDLQISNQMKQAYAASADYKLAGPFLHRLMHTIFHANKRVQMETAYRDGAASISYACAELAKDLVSMHQKPSALVIGVGEMGADVARHLAGSFAELTVVNRTDAKAETLAAQINAKFLPFADLYQNLQNYTVIISAVSGGKSMLNASHFEAKGKYDQRFLLDLCVPRSIAKDVESVPGAIVYDIDDLKTRTDETVARRMAAVPQVKAIIEREMDGFVNWSRELTISPVIQRFKEALEVIRKDELARFLKNADEEETKLVEKVTKSMVNKIIKLPVIQLKAACQRGDEGNLVDVLNDLFNLEEKPVKS